MKTIISLFFILGLVFLVNKSNGQNLNNSYLIGIWQDMPEIADGWSDNYQFFSDGIFKFNFSQMNCTKRIYYIKGNWSLKNDSIELLIKEKKIVEGGVIIEEGIMCDSIIENGITKTIVLNLPEKLVIRIIRKEQSLLNGCEPKIEHISLNNIDFYKIKEDPYDY